MKIVHKPSNLLPPRWRDRLVRAASTDCDVDQGCSEERNRAIDAAIKQIKTHHPQFFR